MHNQIFNTPQQSWEVLFPPWQGTSPFTAVFQVCLQCYLIEVLLSPEDTVQNTNQGITHHSSETTGATRTVPGRLGPTASQPGGCHPLHLEAEPSPQSNAT